MSCAWRIFCRRSNMVLRKTRTVSQVWNATTPTITTPTATSRKPMAPELNHPAPAGKVRPRFSSTMSPRSRAHTTMHYLLQYDLAPDYLERRPEFRDQHLSLAWQAQERGELVLAGALAEPVDGAVFLFRGDSPAAAEAFARTDPYVHHGLVTAWRIRPWTTVVGVEASNPVRPVTQTSSK